MHYTKLNQADNREDHFDPRQLIDLDSDDLADEEEEVETKPVATSPKSKKTALKSIIKQLSPQAKSTSKKPVLQKSKI